MSYQTYPSFRHNTIEFKAVRLAYKDKKEAGRQSWIGTTSLWEAQAEQRKFISQIVQEAHLSQQSKSQLPSSSTCLLYVCTLEQDECPLLMLEQQHRPLWTRSLIIQRDTDGTVGELGEKSIKQSSKQSNAKICADGGNVRMQKHLLHGKQKLMIRA